MLRRAALPAVLVLVSSCSQAAPTPFTPTCPEPPSTIVAPPGSSSARPPEPPTVPATPPTPAESPPRPRAHATRQLFDERLSRTGLLPRGDAFELGLDGAALDDLVRDAEALKSDSLLVIAHDHVVAERYFGAKHGPIETMSITKSVASLAIGALLAEGKIASLDEPLSTWFPEWKTGDRAKVLLRHVLTHTSGIERRPSTKDLNAASDRLAFARALAVVDEPGTTFSYSNEATMLLAGIVAGAAKMPIDEYVTKRFFGPLHIVDFGWAKDGAGTPQTYFGLALTARDLAKIGLLVAQHGTWEGATLVPASFIDRATTPSPEPADRYGLLWWIRFARTTHVATSRALDALGAKGFSATEKLRPLVDHAFDADAAYLLEAGALLDPTERATLAAIVGGGTPVLETKREDPMGFDAEGSLGQYLVVYPSAGIVAVRQHRSRGAGESDKLAFHSFPDQVRATFDPPRASP
jgi:CubicO group peptidase (beta-lactamase class C family)